MSAPACAYRPAADDAFTYACSVRALCIAGVSLSCTCLPPPTPPHPPTPPAPPSFVQILDDLFAFVIKMPLLHRLSGALTWAAVRLRSEAAAARHVPASFDIPLQSSVMTWFSLFSSLAYPCSLPR